MHCKVVQEKMAGWRPNSGDEQSPEFSAELSHVRTCPDCQAHWQRMQADDQILSAAIRHVTIPDQFQSRLVAFLQSHGALLPNSTPSADSPSADSPSADSPSAEIQLGDTHSAGNNALSGISADSAGLSAASPDQQGLPDQVAKDPVSRKSDADEAAQRRRTRFLRRTAWRGVCAAILLIGLGMLWWSGLRRNEVLTIDQLVAFSLNSQGSAGTRNNTANQSNSATQSSTEAQNGSGTAASLASLPVFQRSFEPNLPVYEVQLPRSLVVSPPRSVQLNQREIGAIYSFDVAARPRPARAVLMIVNLKSIELQAADSLPRSFRGAANQYPPPSFFATRVWRDDHSMYICFVESQDSKLLERLQTHNLAG